MKTRGTLLTSLFFCAITAAYGQIKVTQNGGQPEAAQDGSTWETALSAAKLVQRFSGYARGDNSGEYWLAAGVYPFLRPQHEVKIYGGFAGNEKKRTERDPSTNQTSILGLSFAHYDVLDQDNNVVAQKHPGTGTLVDGCTLFSGDATLALSGNYSPGIPLQGAPLVQNCKLVGSPGIVAVVNVGHGPLKLVDCEIRAGMGGGVSVGGADGSVELLNCNIHHNREAGLISWNGGTLKATQCTITANGSDAATRLPAVTRYSGVFVQEATAEIIDSSITENYGELGGGITAVFTEPSSHYLLVVDSTIRGNTTVAAGRLGGGIHSWTTSAPGGNRVSFSNCVIAGNTNLSTSGAGGLYLNGSATRLANCSILDNVSAGDAGGIFAAASQNEASTLVTSIQNSLIARNRAVNGGGLYLQTSNARIINCTIADNVATNQGGAIFSNGNRGPVNSLPELQQNPFIANTALFNNEARQGTLLYHVAAGLFDPGREPVPPAFTNSASSTSATAFVRRMGTSEPLSISAGLLQIDSPQFVGPGDYHLAAGSALIDAGNNLFATGSDLDLNPRILGPAVDIGAYETAAASNPQQLTITQTSSQSLRIQFNGTLQFSPTLSPPAWQNIPASSPADLPIAGQQGYWRAFLP